MSSPDDLCWIHFSVTNQNEIADSLPVIDPNQKAETLPEPPPLVIPPGQRFVRINQITVNAQGQYVVDYETFEYTETLPGPHIHFFSTPCRLNRRVRPERGPGKSMAARVRLPATRQPTVPKTHRNCACWRPTPIIRSFQTVGIVFHCQTYRQQRREWRRPAKALHLGKQRWLFFGLGQPSCSKASPATGLDFNSKPGETGCIHLLGSVQFQRVGRGIEQRPGSQPLRQILFRRFGCVRKKRPEGDGTSFGTAFFLLFAANCAHRVEHGGWAAAQPVLLDFAV